MPRMENSQDDIADVSHRAAQSNRAAGAPYSDVPDPDQRRRDLHASFNDRISYLCKLASLVITLVAFATVALGQEMPRFVVMGLCLAVALLAIASLQDYHQRKR